MTTGPIRLAYLYVGSADVETDLALYRDGLGGGVAFDISSGGTRVAAVRLGGEDAPLWLLADHRPSPSAIAIWEVPSLDAAAERLRSAGWTGEVRRIELPDGPCLLLSDPSGNEIGLLERTRPGILERE